MAAQHQWPGDLPERPTFQFTQKHPKMFDQFETDIGPPKRRRRTSSGTSTISTVWELTGDQVTSLETFYFTTTKGGTESFAMIHPRSGVWSSEMWMDPPVIDAPKGDDHWNVSFDIRVVVP